MRRFALRLLAAVSLLAIVAAGATRPRYGGTLRMSMVAGPVSLDPVANQSDSLAWRNVVRLMFDTLVTLDDFGRIQPGLATSWQMEPGGQRWQFEIRDGVRFTDGSPISLESTAASLRAANPKWRVMANGQALVIECEAPCPDLPAELALPRYGITKRDGGRLAGSGPFTVNLWEPGKKLTLTAREDYWGGRAFVDVIEIDLGSEFREPLAALDAGGTDVIEIAPEQARRAAAENHRVESSSPFELLALVFTKDAASPEESRMRQALALCIDRASINEVLLQGGGEPTGALLPNWMTGDSFLFPAMSDLERAQQLRSEIPHAPKLTLSYDSLDPAARVIAERIVLNARDAGFSLQLTDSGSSDVRLALLPLVSLDARVSLSDLAARTGLPEPDFDNSSPAEIYSAESGLLQTRRVIPLLHLRAAAALGPNVRNWVETRDGGWNLPDVWLAPEKP
ncbi:MAG TPA: ABC transporter substrate-binding protein [Terriglobales bacterium]|nr:ABC transporter substrate-binding protein [Terriglobales bacterium]